MNNKENETYYWFMYFLSRVDCADLSSMEVNAIDRIAASAHEKIDMTSIDADEFDVLMEMEHDWWKSASDRRRQIKLELEEERSPFLPPSL
jgi:hypothetical protein